MEKKQKLSAAGRAGTPRALLRDGQIPSVVYGHGLTTQSIQVNAKEFAHVQQAAGLTTVISLSVGRSEHPVLIRHIQVHPVHSHVIHVDFYQVRMDEEIEAEVPLVFTGEAPAVKDLNGVFVRNLDGIKLIALPANLPHEITVDISGLTDFEKVIHIADLKVPAGVKVLHESTDVVAVVQPPRSAEELEELSQEVKEDVEAVEGIKKEEPTEGEETETAAAPEPKTE